MMHVLLAWRWHLGSPAPLCEWLFFDRSGVEHLNCAAVHHRLRFGDKVLALSHRSDFPERDQAHDACKLNDLQQRFVFKCRLDEIAYEPAAHLVDAAVRIAVHRRPSLFLNVRQELVFERRMLFQRLDELPYLGLDLVLFHELLDLLVGRAVVNPRPSNEAFRSEEHTSELQSLMRSSNAVFCLKKKKNKKKEKKNMQHNNNNENTKSNKIKINKKIEKINKYTKYRQ